MYSTATLLPSGSVLIYGGDNNTTGPFAIAELYNPQTGTWSSTGYISTEHRVGHTATRLNDGNVLIVGGSLSGNNSSTSPIVAEIYDSKTGTVSQTGTMSATRGGHTATLLNNGDVLVAGGYDSNNKALLTAELYTPTTVVPSATPTFPIIPAIPTVPSIPTIPDFPIIPGY